MMAVLDSVPYISLKNTRWFYRGEGNANLVITIPDDKVIIRMEKCNKDKEISPRQVHIREEKLKRGVEFHLKIIMPFLGKVFVQPPFLGRLSKDEIAKLARKLIEKRPDFRLTKGICYELVTVHPDYTFLPPIFDHDLSERPFNPFSMDMHYRFSHRNTLPFFHNEKKPWVSTYCIEIKPKQGWVYPADRHHPKCTYCLNQYLKLSKNRINRISNYCPLDLFSGYYRRMKRAVKNLLFTPQNNLKIFKDGCLVYSDDVKGNFYEILEGWLEPKHKNRRSNRERLLDKWAVLVVEALMKRLTEEPPFELSSAEDEWKHQILPGINSSLNGIIESCDWSPSILPNNCILHRLLMIQKLQQSDFLSLYKIYHTKKNTEEDYEYVNRLLYSSNPPSPVERYLLATTAKDCSIFIAFQETEFQSDNSLHYIQDYDGTMYRMNVGISDIDPKPLSCIEKHYKRDKDIVNAIFKFLELAG